MQPLRSNLLIASIVLSYGYLCGDNTLSKTDVEWIGNRIYKSECNGSSERLVFGISMSHFLHWV